MTEAGFREGSWCAGHFSYPSDPAFCGQANIPRVHCMDQREPLEMFRADPGTAGAALDRYKSASSAPRNVLE